MKMKRRKNEIKKGGEKKERISLTGIYKDLHS